VKCTKPAAKLEFYVQKNIGGAKVQYQNLSLWKKLKLVLVATMERYIHLQISMADWKAKVAIKIGLRKQM